MSASKLLPAAERVEILTARLSSLQSGGGAYSKKRRLNAIEDCRRALPSAQTVLMNERGRIN